MKTGRLSKDEISFIDSNLLNMTDAQIAKQLDRSVEAITQRRATAPQKNANDELQAYVSQLHSKHFWTTIKKSLLDEEIETFENSWANYGSTWQTAQYSIDSNGFVHLRGLIKDGSTSADITSLPTGFQPVMDEIFVVRTSAGTSRVDIKTDGDVYANPGHASWTSLSGITFEAERDKV